MAQTLLFLKPFAPADRRYLVDRLSGAYRIVEPERFDDDVLAASAADADAALGTRLAPAVVHAAKRLRLLQLPAAGADGLDLELLGKAGITVANSHSAATCVAEHALAMLLDLQRRIGAHDRLIRGGTWYRPTAGTPDPRYEAGRIAGTTVGFLGFGQIGAAVHRLLLGFGIEAVAATRRSAPVAPTVDSVDVDELFARADSIVVSVPLTAATAGIVNRRCLFAAKPGSCLVSVSRPGTIDMDALHAALADGRLAGAGLDDWEGDVTGAWRFATFENVVLSPHRAATRLGVNPALEGAVDGLLAFARTGEIVNRVDCAAGY